jgi:modulator of FtsH protease
MNPYQQQVAVGTRSTTEANKLIRNTYTLLAMTLIFSAATAGVSIKFNWPYPGVLITLVGYFGLLFLTYKLKDSAWGLLSIFGLTGFMGLTLGPIVGQYLHLPNGTHIVMTAMGGTGAIFLGLSAYALTSRKDFSFLGGFLMSGILVAFLAGLAAIFFHMPALSLGVAAMFTLLMCGMILFETSQLVNGGETNYILATISLYVSIYNLFLSLLQLIGAFSSDD